MSSIYPLTLSGRLEKLEERMKPSINHYQKKSPSHETIDIAHSFYESDEYIRMMSRKKDFVSIGYKQHMQKRLLFS